MLIIYTALFLFCVVGPKSPNHLSPSYGTSKKSKAGPRSPQQGPTSPKHTNNNNNRESVKQGKISADAFDIFKQPDQHHQQKEVLL